MLCAAAHLLGYVSAISKEQYDELKDKGYSLNATVGAAGVEAAFEEYLHGKDGEVEASVFDRYRTPLYKEASYKPYIIAAMIFLAKVKDPQATLKALEERGIARWFQK